MRRSSPEHKIDPAEALMREVGAQLRQVRLERGEDLETVAQYLRIKPAYLAGIEEGDLSTLPGRTYALGFLRSYGDHLGFDGQDLVTQIKSAVGNLTKKQRLRIHAPMPESRLPKAPVLAISLMLILAIYGVWSYIGGSGEPMVETVGEVPEDLRQVAIDALAPEPEGVAPDEPQSRAETPSPPSAVASSTVSSGEVPADPAAESGQNGLEHAVAAQAPVAATPVPETSPPTDRERTSAVASATQGPVERPEDAFEPGAGPPEASAGAGAASGPGADGGGPDGPGRSPLEPGDVAGAAAPSATRLRRRRAPGRCWRPCRSPRAAAPGAPSTRPRTRTRG
jgi:cytoskeleton protein RodZ